MGTDFWATAAIGLRVPREKVYTLTRERIFLHDYPEDWTHCPKTGKQLWCEDETALDVTPYKIVDTGEAFERGDSLASHVVVSLVKASGDSSRSSAKPERAPIPDAKQIATFRQKMKSLDLWDESEFGLWAVLEVSY